MQNSIFDAHADKYDAWYDTEAGKSIFAMEVDCLEPLLHRHKRPYLEIGVGSGRFAQALGIEYGVDPSSVQLRMAESRGIHVLQSTGEKLPLEDETIGGVLIAFTLCFIDDPTKLLQEAWRVLQPGAGLVLGLIFRSSPWAKFYVTKGREGHPIYSRAHFFSKGEVDNLLRLSGFRVLDCRSTLFQLPGQNTYRLERPVSGYRRSAGFVAIGSCKGEPKTKSN